MSNYNSLKATINANVKQNGNQEITGQVLNGVLNAMVNSLGAGYQYIGIATPTSPGSDQTPDYKCFYLALTPGTYSHLGGLVVNEGEVCILKFDTSWTKEVTGIATAASVQAKQDIITDLATIRSGAASGATAVQPAALAAYFLISNIVSQLGESADKVISQAGITAILADYAKSRGVYDEMIVGSAKGLIGYGADPASFLFRKSGGDNEIGTGAAMFKMLKGNSCVWNQLVLDCPSRSEVYGITRTKVNNYTLHYSGTSSQSSGFTGTATTISVINGHKYYCSVRGNIPAGVAAIGGSGLTFPSGVYEAIITSISTATNSSLGINIPIGTEIDTDVTFVCVDLTQLFNGSVPANFSVADFKALFPLNYYASNSGKVIPFAAQNLVTTGFNQWDEEWELGNITDSGEPTPSTSFIRSKNFIPIFPGMEYYFRIPLSDPGSYLGYAYFYDANKSFIGSKTLIPSATQIVTSPAGAYFMKFVPKSAYGTTYKNDTCINLSCDRNGEYEPYEKHTLEVDPASWEDTDGNLIFPYGGMFKAGTAYDFAKAENDGYFHHGTRVFERVDLGTLTWNYSSTYSYFYAVPQGIKQNDYTDLSLRCAVYAISPWTLSSSTDKAIRYAGVGQNGVFVRDSAYTDAATFKAAMSGVYLYYELATPVTKELATPVPASYYVNDFGTEEWQPANTADPYTAPCNLEIAYAMDAVDTLRRLGVNYIKKQSMDNILTAFKTAGIISAYSLTYNSETDEYDCSVTA